MTKKRQSKLNVKTNKQEKINTRAATSIRLIKTYILTQKVNSQSTFLESFIFFLFW